jgi:two-component system, cell cycle sensor histidine kinase and response regulator CckA
MHSRAIRRLRKSAGPFALSSIALALIVATGYRFRLDAVTVALLCLLVIVLHALADGFVSSALVSLAAGAGLIYFFLYPVFNFRIDHVDDIVAFGVFLVVSNGLAWLGSKTYRTLRHSQQQLALAENAAHIAIWDRDLRTSAIAISGEYKTLYGLPASQRAPTTDEWLSLIHPEDREQVRAHYEDAIARTRVWDEEFRVVWEDGSVHWLLGKGTVFGDETGRPVRMAGINIDITDRKYIAEALRQSEERFRLAIQATNDAVWDIDLATGTVSWNEMYTALFGRPPETSKSWQWWIDRLHPEDRERASGGLISAISGSDSTWTCEYRIQRSDGGWAYIYDRAYIARDPSGKAWRMIGAMQDLTQRKRAEADLRESEYRLKNAERLAHVGHWQWDIRSNTVSGSEEMYRIFGKPPEYVPNYEGFLEDLEPRDRGRMERLIRDSLEKKIGHSLEYQITLPNGDRRSISCIWELLLDEEGMPVRIFGTCQDTTDSRRAQEQSIARQRLESVGTLANGIAHDFNNLLGGMLAQAELALDECAGGRYPEEELNTIRRAAIGGSEIVRQLMAYAGTESEVIGLVDVSRIVKDTLDLLKASVSKHAVLETDLGEDLPAILANAAQVRQIVMNLVTNASDALGERDGVIRVTTQYMKSERNSHENGLTNIDHLQLGVSDTGRGMTAEIRARVFDPFFTTKSAGRGLGLAVVHGIVRDLGGTIDIASEPGKGATFQVLLPVAKTTAAASEAASGVPEKASTFQGVTLLFVEDEEFLRQAIAKMLRKTGFKVLEAADGSSAIELLGTHGREIDLILLDMIIPGASSQEIVVEASRIRPDVRVILTSAQSQEMMTRRMTAPQIRAFIRKPFQLEALVKTLRNTLSS